jgi:hypothetical protein
VAAPTADDLSAFVGQELNADQANAVVSVVTALASAYTRGQGFTAGEPDSNIRAVILSASARLVADTSQIVQSQQMGPFVTQYSGDHSVQWSTAELYVLNRYRVRAQ